MRGRLLLAKWGRGFILPLLLFRSMGMLAQPGSRLACADGVRGALLRTHSPLLEPSWGVSPTGHPAMYMGTGALLSEASAWAPGPTSPTTLRPAAPPRSRPRPPTAARYGGVVALGVGSLVRRHRGLARGPCPYHRRTRGDELGMNLLRASVNRAHGRRDGRPSQR